MRPYIVCHMVESIDGRIDCDMVDKIRNLLLQDISKFENGVVWLKYKL